MACDNSFEDLWEDEDLADVVFYVGINSTTGVWRIPAHKLVLSSSSRVFREMFFEKSLNSNEDSSPKVLDMKMRNKTQENDHLMEVTITDVPPDIFDHFLRYLYRNKLEIYTISSALLLHYVGVKYEVNAVRDTAFKYLISNVDSRSVFSVFNYLFESVNSEEIDFPDRFSYNLSESLKSNAFTHLSLEVIKCVLSKINSKISFRNILMDALFHWSVAECKRRHLVVNNENKSLILEKVIDKIPFNSKTAANILQNYVKKGMINRSDKESFHSVFQPKPSFSVCRFKGSFIFEKEDEKNYSYREHCLGFMSDKPLLLTSVVLTANSTSTHKCEGSKMIVIKNFQTLIQKSIRSLHVQNNQMFICFPNAISIIPHIIYKIYTYLTFPCYNIIGADTINPECKWRLQDEEGAIMFLDCSLPDYDGTNNSSISYGQLYKLFFKLP